MSRQCDIGWGRYRLKVWLIALMLALPLWIANHESAAAAPAQTAFEFAQELDVSQGDISLFLLPLTAEELATVAETWQTYLRTELESRMLAELKLRTSTGGVHDILSEAVGQSIIDQREIIAKLLIVLEMWRQKGGDEKDIAPYESYTASIRSVTARISDTRTIFRFATSWAVSPDGGLGVLAKFLGLLLALWLMKFIARGARRLSDRGFNRIPNLSRLLRKFMSGLVFWLVYGLGISILLGMYGVNMNALFAVLGGVSFILGFAMQETLGDLASGLMIMILKPFDTGDYIQTAGTAGVVEEMSVVSTRIRTFDNQIIMVPNSKVWGNVITNVSASKERRVDLVFRIAYSSNSTRAISILRELVSAHEFCLSDPKPLIFIGALGDESVNVFCRPWVKTENYWTVYWDMLAQVKERFEAEGISIPLPQREVHLVQASQDKLNG